jgi:hypothetical protein
MVWRIRSITAGGAENHDAMPYPTLNAAVRQARYLLSVGAKDVWITDLDGKLMSKAEIEAHPSN